MKVTDEDLVRYADNTLSPERKQRLMDAALRDSDLADTLAALDASQLPFKAAFDQQPVPPVPDALRKEVAALTTVAGSEGVTSIHSGSAARRARQPMTRWAGRFAQAACLMLFLGAGYLIGVKQGDSAVDVADATDVSATT